MNDITRPCSKIWNTVLMTLLLMLPLLGNAAPGNLPQVPLFVSNTTEPNIMFLIDNSGSMSNIVPDTPYDPTIIYFSCLSPSTVFSSTTDVNIRITLDGEPYFNDYDWGTGSGNGISGREKRCFDPAASYSARLFANSGDPKTPTDSGNYLKAQYKGNYLNWYFGWNTASPPTGTTPLTGSYQAVNNFGAGADRKPNTKQRIEIAKESATNLVNTTSNVRVGLATYDGDSGARIKVDVKSISSNISAMTSGINGLTPTGATPLAKSLSDIGRYFVGFSGSNNPGHQTSTTIITNGQYTGNLILHPDQLNQASVSINDVFNNHLPVMDSGVNSESPICYWCQKNFAILLTDGRPQNDQNISSSLSDYDSDCDNQNPPCDTYDRKPNRQYESAGSDYLDDVAKALYDIDLRPDIKDGSRPIKNNVITYTIGFADDQVINDPLMQDTADNGGGLFLTAANSGQLNSAFQSALKNIQSQLGSAAAVSFNSGDSSTNTKIFLSLFHSSNWIGQLIAYALDPNTGLVNNTPVWDASVLLDSRNLTTSPRIILTNGSSDGVAFQWDNLSDAQKNDLRTSPSGTIDTDAKAQARLAFLRGSRVDEGQGYNLRVRGSRLGDIVHSSSVFVGAPALGWPDTTPFPTGTNSYSNFTTGSAKNRTGIVYIGANDGMLHAFQESDGHEVLAFIPSNLFSTDPTAGLHYLTDPGYNHLFYVDLTPVVSDVYIKTATTGTVGWKTVLVGGERGGGRGYFALDITDPSAFSEAGSNPANIVMWEFTDANDADLGFSFSNPTLALMNNGKWAAIFGNGYNSTGNGEAQLFILYLEDGVDGTWSAGDYVKISTGVGNTSDPNGLSTPATVDLDGNGTVDRVYAGDLRGNLWAFDLSASTSSGWGVAYGTTPQPLFAAGASEPITAEPVVIKNKFVTDIGNAPNLLIFFGTGQYLVDNDKNNTNTQSFYGVWDQGTASLTSTNLVAQTFLAGAITGKDNNGISVTRTDLRVLTNNSVDFTSGNGGVYGWHINLPASGERVVVSPVVRGNVVFFNTLIPSTEPCTYGGSGYLMSVDLRTGGRPATTPFDLNGSGKVDANDFVSVGSSQNLGVSGQGFEMGIPTESTILSNYQYTPGTKTTEGSQINIRLLEPLESPIRGRLSWEELENN